MVLTTSLLEQEEAVGILNQVLHDPPHLFFSGGYGCGKTTLMHEFLQAYYKPHGILPSDGEWVLNLSSEQDRGIHCVRQSVAEFVRHTSSRPGVYRWIIVDDADSLPIISQQALRRPMETHAHTTRFLFLSRHSTDLIPPIKSRCLHVELETISPSVLVKHFCTLTGFPDLSLEPNAIAMFMSIAQTPTEIRNVTRVLARVFGSKNPSASLNSQDLVGLFASPSFSLCLELLKAYVRGDREKMMSVFLEIWKTGISYEDFLYELTASVHQMGVLPPKISQDIHQVILRGWIYFAQGKTHSLDLMRLFFGADETQAP
jgi:hypothetical protein